MLREETSARGVVVEAYCLMANHVHLVLTPRTADGLKLAVGRTHWRYSQAINRLHGRSGHLWQGRFFSCPLLEAGEDSHLVAAVRYVERNPVRARIVRAARRYEWSSAEAHCGGKDRAGLVNPQAWRRRATAKQ